MVVHKHELTIGLNGLQHLVENFSFFIVRHFVQQLERRLNKKVETIPSKTLAALTRYDWPGNIRELENVVERAVNLVDGPVILANHVLVQGSATTNSAPISDARFPRLGEAVAETEREALLQAIRVHRSSRKLGAALGISHTAALKKLKKYGIAFPVEGFEK